MIDSLLGDLVTENEGSICMAPGASGLLEFTASLLTHWPFVVAGSRFLRVRFGLRFFRAIIVCATGSCSIIRGVLSWVFLRIFF
jgi:hypothetical protein